MNLVACSVRDAKSEVWMAPMFVRTKGEALRSFVDEVNSDPSKSAIAAHPEDYTLFYLGTFDQLTGLLVPAVQPESLGVGENFRREAVRLHA